MAPKEVYVAIIGAGGVGSVFVQQLARLAEVRTETRIRLCYIAIIDRALFYPDYRDIDIDTSLDELEKHGQDPPTIPQIIDYLSGVPGKVIVADNTSSQAIAESYPEFAKRGMSIITPNKKAFSGSYKLWEDIFNSAESSGAMVYHESSVGAGMPIISTLKDLVDTGDEITRIEGIFSGTMSYLFNQFAPSKGSGGKWSDEVKKAKELGYTEPDPRDDLNGLDVARKLTILGRLAGLPIESPTSFPVQSLIPKELEACASSAEFMEKLAQFDDQMEQHKAAATKQGKVIRYIGSIDFATKDIKVALEMFEPTHPIASLQGSDNIISFYTKRYGVLPLTIRGAGAGGDVTAMGVTGDFLKIVTRVS